MLIELLNDAVEIRIAGANAPSDHVPTAFGDPPAGRDHVELAGAARLRDGFDAEALPDAGHETRDLGLLFCQVGQYTISIFIPSSP